MATLTIADLDNGKRDLQTVDGVANSRAASVTTRYGQQTTTLYEAIRRINATGDAILANLGYFVPVDYAPELSVTEPNFTVIGPDGKIYAAQAGQLPFTTGAWNPGQWYPIQNDLNDHKLLVFDTLAEAEAAAATLPDGQRIEIVQDEAHLGRSTQNVVQAGSLVFVGLKSDADSISFKAYEPTAVSRTVQEKLRDIASVKDFGAVGDGISDDTLLVQACFNAFPGKAIVFPPGHYKLNTLTVPKDTYISAYGAVLDFSSSDQTGLIFKDGGGMFGGEVKGFDGTVFGNATGIHAAGIDNTPAAPTYIRCPIIRDVSIHNFSYHGIFFEFVKDGYVENCTVHTCGYGGVGGVSMDRVNFDHNIIHDIEGVGAPDTYGVIVSSWENSLIASPRSTNCAVRHNTIYNVPNWEGIDTHGGTQLSIIGNILVNCRFGIAVVGGESDSVLDRGAKDISIVGNVILGRDDGACITIAGTDLEYASGIVVSGNVLKDGGEAGNASSGAIRAYDCYGLTISGNSIQTPYVYGINLIQNLAACTVTGNTIVDPRDNTREYPSCIVITSDGVRASIFGNTLSYASSDVGTYVSVLSIGIASSLSGLDVEIGRNALIGIGNGKLIYSEGTQTGVNAAGLMIARGRAQIQLIDQPTCYVSVDFQKRFPVNNPKIFLTIAGPAVSGSVQKTPVLESDAVTAVGFSITARPYDLTTFGGSGVLDVDWFATT